MDIKSQKAEDFALRIIKLHSYLKENGEYIMSKQILRAGTSIGANIAESIFSESSEDLIHKLHISIKEASETSYWLRLLYRSEFIDEKLYISLQSDCQEILKILTSILIKLKSTRK